MWVAKNVYFPCRKTNIWYVCRLTAIYFWHYGTIILLAKLRKRETAAKKLQKKKLRKNLRGATLQEFELVQITDPAIQAALDRMARQKNPVVPANHECQPGGRRAFDVIEDLQKVTRQAEVLLGSAVVRVCSRRAPGAAPGTNRWPGNRCFPARTLARHHRASTQLAPRAC